MTAKEKAIENYMKSLDISREEAEQLWEDDNSGYESEEMKEMGRKAKENVKRYEQSDKKRAKSTRERKVDEEKKFILDVIVAAVANGVNAEDIVTKTETEVSFKVGENDYTLKLTKHRKPKA